MKTALITLASFWMVSAAIHAAEKPAVAKPEVLVVADAIQNVPEGLRPSPGKPIYYLLGKTILSLGESVAGIKMPKPAEVEQAIISSLASQGFIRAEIGGPVPSIFIIASWGDANFADFDFRDPNADPDLQRAMDRASPRERDRMRIENLVGTSKLRTKFMGPAEMEKIATASNEDRLFISIAALDAAAFREKQKILLWRTSMTIDARHKLADVMPVMLASAAPFFGRNADTPVFVDDKYRRNFEVNVGEVRVVPDDHQAERTAPAEKK